MAAKVHYEWSYQCIDQHGDIIDHYFVDHLKELPSDPLRLCIGGGDCVKHDLELWRNTWDTVDDNLLDREYALVENDRLPDETDCGSRVPQKYQTEFRKWHDERSQD